MREGRKEEREGRTIITMMINIQKGGNIRRKEGMKETKIR